MGKWSGAERLSTCPQASCRRPLFPASPSYAHLTSRSPGVDRAAENDAAEARAARLEAERAQSAEQISRLEHLVEEFRKALFGRKSEKLGADERQLSFDDLGTAIAEAGGQTEPAGQAPDEEAGARQRRRRRGPRSEVRFPSHLERITEVIEPDTVMCPCGCGVMTRIGEDRSERLDVVPAQFRVIKIVRPRYACNRCKGGGVVQAPAPRSLIEGGLPSEGLLAHVLISKYGDHCPLYRLSQIYARSGVEVHRATLASWVGRAAFHLRPVVDCLEMELKRSEKLGLDETRFAFSTLAGARRATCGPLCAMTGRGADRTRRASSFATRPAGAASMAMSS